jgi:Ethanolamine utilization protein EutJ (predicted chaperonin)
MQSADFKRLKDSLIDVLMFLNTGRETNACDILQIVIDELAGYEDYYAVLNKDGVIYQLNQSLKLIKKHSITIDKLLKENQSLKDYKWKYEELCK